MQLEWLSELRRAPDIEAPDLVAADATDRLLLRSTTDQLRASTPGDVVIIGDRHGALTLGALTLGAARVRVHQDALLGERALAANARLLGIAPDYEQHDLDETLVRGARLVLMQLPGSLAALREIADLIARVADPDVTVLAGGRVKHMTLRQNEVLAECFEQVHASLAHQKSRMLTATSPRVVSADPPFPVSGSDPDVSVKMFAYGQTFGGATLDHGTRLLLKHLRVELTGDRANARHIVDLGCGNGVIAAELALALPDATVIATDQSRAAVRAAQLTVQHAQLGPQVRVERADACEAIPDGWADLIVLNPPFHSGHTVHASIAHRLIESTRRALAPGGELWVVYNSHLRYRPVIERAVGPTTQVARDRSFTVVRATRV